MYMHNNHCHRVTAYLQLNILLIFEYCIYLCKKSTLSLFSIEGQVLLWVHALFYSWYHERLFFEYCIYLCKKSTLSLFNIEGQVLLWVHALFYSWYHESSLALKLFLIIFTPITMTLNRGFHINMVTLTL